MLCSTCSMRQKERGWSPSEPGEPGRYAFVHAIVRETLAGTLTAARRAHIHDLFARILEQRADTDPDGYLAAAANHALEAAAGHGDPERAAALAEQVASRAGAVLAYEDAAELLRRAVAVLERHRGSAARRAELTCALGEALARAGSTDADATLREANELARAAGRSDLIARVALAQGGTGVTILGADSNARRRAGPCARRGRPHPSGAASAAACAPGDRARLRA